MSWHGGKRGVCGPVGCSLRVLGTWSLDAARCSPNELPCKSDDCAITSRASSQTSTCTGPLDCHKKTLRTTLLYLPFLLTPQRGALQCHGKIRTKMRRRVQGLLTFSNLKTVAFTISTTHWCSLCGSIDSFINLEMDLSKSSKNGKVANLNGFEKFWSSFHIMKI